jgi:preprotein translocase subunit YajC
MIGQENLQLPGQDGAAPVAGEGAGAAPPPRSDPFGSEMFLLLFGLLALMLVWSMLGQRRDRKKRDAMLSAIKKHDRVQTLGGIIGSIVEIRKDVVVLKVDESSNTRITFARSAVQQVLSHGPAEAEPAAEDKP